MKKGVCFLLVILLVFNILIISSQLDNFEEELEKNIEDIEQKKENIETKWDYLGNEWKNILLKNDFVNGMDGFFLKISFLFEIFFREPYSLSLTLLIIIILWFYFFFKFKEILIDYSLFSSAISVILSIGLNIILAQTGLFRKIVEFFGWLVFSQEASWIRWIIALAIFVIAIIIYRFTSLLGDAHKKSVEELEKEQAKLDRKTLRYVVNAIVKGLKNK